MTLAHQSEKTWPQAGRPRHGATTGERRLAAGVGARRVLATGVLVLRGTAGPRPGTAGPRDRGTAGRRDPAASGVLGSPGYAGGYCAGVLARLRGRAAVRRSGVGRRRLAAARIRRGCRLDPTVGATPPPEPSPCGLSPVRDQPFPRRYPGPAAGPLHRIGSGRAGDPGTARARRAPVPRDYRDHDRAAGRAGGGAGRGVAGERGDPPRHGGGRWDRAAAAGGTAPEIVTAFIDVSVAPPAPSGSTTWPSGSPASPRCAASTWSRAATTCGAPSPGAASAPSRTSSRRSS